MYFLQQNWLIIFLRSNLEPWTCFCPRKCPKCACGKWEWEKHSVKVFHTVAKAVFIHGCDLWLGRVMVITCKNCAISFWWGTHLSVQTSNHAGKGLCAYTGASWMCVCSTPCMCHVLLLSSEPHLPSLQMWLSQAYYQSQNNIHSSELLTEQSLVWQDQLMT